MTFGNTSILDNFTRADGDGWGANWTEPMFSIDTSSDCDISGNQGRSGAADGTVSGAYWNVATFGPDCEAYVTVGAKPDNGRIADVNARIHEFTSTYPDGYRVRLQSVTGASNDLVTIWRVDDGTGTQLGAAITQEVAPGDKLGIECIGDQISAYLFTGGVWTLLGTRTDATYNVAGYIGLRTNDDTTRFDNFGGGSIGTRFYLPSTGAAAVSPGFDAGWEETGDADRIKAVTTRISSAMTDKSLTTLITAGDALLRQYVSDPLNAQTITGGVRIQARASEALATVDAISRIVLKVVSNDGSSVTGTLLALGDFSTGTEWNTSLRNKTFADGDTPSSVAANAGDRLVLEMGFNHAAVISSAAINFGDDSATDLPTDETATAANNPWLYVDQVLTFAAAGSSIVPILMGEYRRRRN